MILLRSILSESRPIGIPRDAWRVISRTANKAMGEHWHREMLPDHFTEQARFRYRHQLRSGKYRKKKERMAQMGAITASGAQVALGGRVDNVLTGYMMEQLKSSKAIRAFPTRITVEMYGPKYMSARTFSGDVQQAIREGWKFGKNRRFNSRMGNQPNKIREITTVTAAQNKELVRVLEQSVSQQLDAYRAPRTTHI